MVPIKTDRKNYKTTHQTDLNRDLKILSANLDRGANDLIEEAIRDLLKKYDKAK